MTPSPDNAPHRLAPHLSPQPPTSTTNGRHADETQAPSANGRDSRGRFTKGNPGGPGNPFARHQAALRQALCQAVSQQDIQAIAHRLVVQAQAGDVAAAKLLLAYAVGKPAEPADPDTLDQHEWGVLRRTPVDPKEVRALTGCLPVGFVCQIMRPTLYAVARTRADQMAEVLASREQHEARKQAQRARRAARRKAGPSTPAAAPDQPADSAPQPEATQEPAPPAETCSAPGPAADSSKEPSGAGVAPAVTDANGLNGGAAPADTGRPRSAPRRPSAPKAQMPPSAETEGQARAALPRLGEPEERLAGLPRGGGDLPPGVRPGSGGDRSRRAGVPEEHGPASPEDAGSFFHGAPAAAGATPADRCRSDRRSRRAGRCHQSR
jgi:hypothetical protein